MVTSNKLAGWTALFLISTVLTSVTGFFFPLVKVGPPHIIGAISLVLLAASLLGIYVYRLAGSWRWIYVVTTLIALWFNVAVGIIQAFQKLSFLKPLAPTQSEPPFLATQLVVLALFVVFGWLAVRRFHPVAQLA